jgi:hypothetical protein
VNDSSKILPLSRTKANFYVQSEGDSMVCHEAWLRGAR